jgi:quercetin dioxygenase-like cupin family protein
MTAPTEQSQLRIGRDAQFRFLGAPTIMQATGETTNGGFGLIESYDMPVGFGTPYHMHHREDEAFYVLEGEFAVVLDGKWKIVGAGEYVFGPREIPHGFQVVSGPAHLLLLCSPAGFEHFVLDQATEITDPVAPPDMARLMTLATQYGIDILGPLPERPE